MKMPLPPPLRRLVPAVLIVAVPTLTGCVSARYQLADRDAPPALPLNLRHSAPPLRLTIDNVILYHGPGSWKRHAYWDEYVLTLTNAGVEPIRIEAVTLVYFQGAPVSPGNRPWQLEEESREFENRFETTTGEVLKLGAGTLGVGAAGLTVSAIGVAANAGAMVYGGLVAAPVFLGATVYRNVSGRMAIETEFARRRIVLPLALSAGETRQGSWFFRLTPGPQRLVLRYTRDGHVFDAVFDLSALRRNHLGMIRQDFRGPLSFSTTRLRMEG